MSEETIAEGISLADRMTRLNAAEPTFDDGGHAEGTDGHTAAKASFDASHATWTTQKADLQAEIDAA